MLKKRMEHGRNKVQNRHAVRFDDFFKILHIPVASRNGHDQTRPSLQCREDFPYRYIEPNGCLLQYGICFRQTVLILHPDESVHHTTVFDHHTLGKTRRSRGVDHIRQVRRVLTCLIPADVAFRLPRIGRLFIEQQNLSNTTANTTSTFSTSIQRLDRSQQVFLQPLLRQQHPCLRVLEHVRNPVCRILRIHRHIRRACLQNPLQPNHHLEASLHTDRHPLIRPDHRVARFIPQSPQPVRQLVGPGIELSIAELLILELHRHRIRGALDLLLKELMDQRFLRIRRLRGVEPMDDMSYLILIHDGDSINSDIFISQNTIQHQIDAIGHPFDFITIQKCSVIG